MENTLSLKIDEDGVRQLVDTVVKELLEALSWPPGKIALDEAQAAAACGVGRHVLRDLRQTGQVSFTKVGKRILYRRNDLQELLDRNAFHSVGGKR